MDEMSRLPEPPQLSALMRDGPVALFLDFDGTLVELAATPDAISVPRNMPTKLRALSQALDGRLALVSGRSITDLEKHLGQLGVAVAGSHGADCRLASGQALGQAPQGISAEARASLSGFAQKEGLDLEEKSHGAALHFRNQPEKERVAHDFASTLSDKHGLAVKTGKCVVELVESGANKGAAVNAFMDDRLFAGSVPWFIGDDITDEDGFRACQDRGGGGILVGEREETRAGHAFADVTAVRQWLGI
ncbi:MAG: trehalose-phosphatase [Erythrobacter sp.]|uniref:trehalose-phosphatase n=1 Tax=Erythrobacter sp. TaxID=1042 RepID=UPI003266AA11